MLCRARPGLIRGDVFYWDQLMAAALPGSVPVAIIYPSSVDYDVDGLTTGSVTSETGVVMADKKALIENLDRAVREVLTYFEGPGRTATAKVDRWLARDVLQHFIYFHDATAWGIQSVAIGGPVWPIPGDSDIVNEVCRRLHTGESFDDLLAQVRLAHGRLMFAARNSPDLDQPCFKRATGEMMTGAQRLEVLAKHWRDHVHELQTAERMG